MNEGDLVAGRYRLLRPIGAGATGTVWAARHELLGRDFALKVASLSPWTGPEIRTRFLREAQIVGKLRHPNVVDVADVGDVGSGAGLYLAMELLSGQSLAERIAEHGPFSPAEAIAIASEVCRGLAAAHAAGVVHRDIKPQNIFLARGPSGGIVPKLLDFGISKVTESRESLITQSGQLFGTPAYMSPEQALGELDIDLRTDVWSLGVVLYEMLTGRRPFAAESYPALLPLIAEKAFIPLPDSVPAEIQAIIARCLAKPKADRFPSADALRSALDALRGAPNRASVSPEKIERSRALPSLYPRDALASSAAISPSTMEARPAQSTRGHKRGVGRPLPSSFRTLVAGGIALAVAIGAVSWRSYLRTHASGPPAEARSAGSAAAPGPAPPSPAPPPTESAGLPAAAASSAPPELAEAAPPPPKAGSAPAQSAKAGAPWPGSRTRPTGSGNTVTKVNSAGF